MNALTTISGVLSMGLSLLLQVGPGGPPSPGPAKPPMAWASVSIHPSDPDRRMGAPDADHTGTDGEGGVWHGEPDGFTDRGVSLRELISQGYNFSVLPLREDEISGLPDWAKTARYDVVARVDGDDVAAYKKLTDLPMAEFIAAMTARQTTGDMLMMQALLAERFALRVHWEAKERSVYALTVAKGGIRMKPAADPAHGEVSISRGHVSGKGVPVSFLGSLLAMPTGRTVVDKTGVTGSYDFDLHFDPRDGASGPESNYPDLFTAVQEQLGVKLEGTRAPVPVLVVDHVEPPTEN